MTATADKIAPPGKRVSWVELYLDLIFVLAVSQLAHLIEDEPEMHSVWVALGLFMTLWWTWIGFAVIYNRHGADQPRERVLFLAGSVPAGIAAVAIEPASVGDSTVFALSLAATRVVLAIAVGDWTDGAQRRVAAAYLVAAAMLVVSISVPEPARYVLWALAIAGESGAVLHEDREAMRRARREHNWSVLRDAEAPDRLDPHHFAERFGLFLIILLGEVVVSAGTAAVDGHVATFDGWAALGAAMLIAAALWWLYFDAASDVNLKVLELSGGSPTVARAIFAVGHTIPAFALLITAAGVGLLLDEDPPRMAYWLPCVGIGMYLASTRLFLIAGSRPARILRIVLLLATFQLGRLHEVLSPHAFIWLLAGWTLTCAYLTTRQPELTGVESLERRFGG